LLLKNIKLAKIEIKVITKAAKIFIFTLVTYSGIIRPKPNALIRITHKSKLSDKLAWFIMLRGMPNFFAWKYRATFTNSRLAEVIIVIAKVMAVARLPVRSRKISM